MSSNIPKISVIIITYNQEELIKRSIDSVLYQKEYIHEIIVSDDCSIDNTWKVLNDYQSKHPNFVKIYRHESNKGIFGNLESTWNKPTGDLIHLLAGDDEVCPELFKKTIDLVAYNNVNYKEGSFCIYSDSMAISKNGKEKVLSNKMIAKGYDSVSLKIRGHIGSIRGIIYSKDLFGSFSSPKKNIGLCTDGLYDIQVHIKSKKNYYIPYVGGIYYTGVGVASTSSIINSRKSLIMLYNIYFNELNLSNKDKYYLKFKIESLSYFLAPSFWSLLKSIMFYIRSIEIKYGLRFTSFSRLLLKMLLESLKKRQNDL